MQSTSERDFTVVVQVLPLWVAVTSIEPVPIRILDPDTVDWPGGTLGSTSSNPLTELGIDTELLVHDWPQHPVSTPCLIKRRALVEGLGDVRIEVRRRTDLRHRARLLFDRADLELRQVVGVALLVGGTEKTIVAEPYGHHPGVEGVRHLRLIRPGAGVAPRGSLDVHAICP